MFARPTHVPLSHFNTEYVFCDGFNDRRRLSSHAIWTATELRIVSYLLIPDHTLLNLAANPFSNASSGRCWTREVETGGKT